MFNIDFLEKGLGKFPRYILRMLFREKCFVMSYSIIDQISLPNCLYFLRYWATCALQLLVLLVITS